MLLLSQKSSLVLDHRVYPQEAITSVLETLGLAPSQQGTLETTLIADTAILIAVADHLIACGRHTP